jgi:hypothetical protein
MAAAGALAPSVVRWQPAFQNGAFGFVIGHHLASTACLASVPATKHRHAQLSTQTYINASQSTEQPNRWIDPERYIRMQTLAHRRARPD